MSTLFNAGADLTYKAISYTKLVNYYFKKFCKWIFSWMEWFSFYTQEKFLIPSVFCLHGNIAVTTVIFAIKQLTHLIFMMDIPFANISISSGMFLPNRRRWFKSVVTRTWTVHFYGDILCCLLYSFVSPFQLNTPIDNDFTQYTSHLQIN